MKVLIVDNDQERQETLARLFGGQVVACASTCEKACEVLTDRPPDLVCLDYDLDGETTEPIALWISALGDAAPLSVIHSENPLGVQVIRSILPLAEPISFSRLTDKNPFTSRLKQLLSQRLGPDELPQLSELFRSMSKATSARSTRR